MATYYVPFLDQKYVNGAFVHDGTKYPKGWFDKFSEAALADNNIVKAPEYDSSTHTLVHTNDPENPFSLEAIPPLDLNTYKAMALNDVDGISGNVRIKYITATFGQDMTYLTKYEDALKVVNGEPSDISFVTKEAAKKTELTGSTVTELEVANLIISMHNLWKPIGSDIEASRVAWKDKISSATSHVEVDTLKATAINELNAY